MNTVHTEIPSTAEELAEILASANRDSRRLGRDFALSFTKMNSILQYNADDLTMSVEAGVTLDTINAALAEHQQWLPIGAPRPASVTASAAVMQNYSGPFRLFYGSLRDMVIGVRFATVEGKLVKSGGNVVKNVAGYDLGKLLIGSRDTLAILAQVNFRLYPRPPLIETLAFGFASATAALKARTAIQQSQLTPLAMDLLDAGASRVVLPASTSAWTLLVAYGGVARVIERYRRDLASLAGVAGATIDNAVWDAITDLPATMEEASPELMRVRAASTLANVGACVAAVDAQCTIARAGSGVTYFYTKDGVAARAALRDIAESVVIEYSPSPVDNFGATRDNFELMTRIKHTFDPNGILNPGVFVGGL